MSKLTIPPLLVSDLVRSQVVLFVGPGLTSDRYEEQGLPSLAKLTGELVQLSGSWTDCPLCAKAGQCSQISSCVLSFPKVAGDYVYSNDRNSLIRFLRERLDANSTPLLVHKAIARLAQTGLRVIVTTSYDNLIEAALQQCEQTMLIITRDTEVPYDDPKHVQVIRLYGKLEDASTLILTEDDRADVFAHLPTVSTVLRGHLASKTLLFVGFDLTDPYFRILYRDALRGLDRHERQAFALLWPPRHVNLPSSIRIVEMEPADFLEQLADEASAKLGIRSTKAAKVDAHLLPLPSSPYKFLDYFSARDEAIFYGREGEIDAILSRVLAHKLTVLYGHSGAGKTSLLLAGVIPRLEREGYICVYIRALNDPTQGIKKALQKLLDHIHSPTANSQLSLHTYIDEALPVGQRLVVVLDQFEEFFIRLGRAVQHEFVAEIANCLASKHDVRFIISLREDYLSRLDTFSQADPMHTLPQDVLHNRFRLRNLVDEKAYQAIIAPAANFGLIFDDDLLTQLLTDLDVSGIEPTQLQIVCYRLYQALVASGAWLPDSHTEGKFSLELYRSLGGTDAILRSYLDNVLAELANENVLREFGLKIEASQAVKGAQKILKNMITAEQTKATVSAREIVASELVEQEGLDQITLLQILHFLQSRRVVRELGDNGPYELAHDIMVTKIWEEWINDADIAQLNVRDMLRRELTNYAKFGHLLDRQKLMLVYEQQMGIAFDALSLEFIFRSALAHGIEVTFWFERARSAGVVVDKLILTALNDPDFRVRAASVTILSELGEQFIPQIQEMLSDNYPQVRLAAIVALEKLESSGQWRMHLVYERYIPAGSFTLGDDSKEPEEKPAHKIELRGFYINRYPVTNAEYKLFMEDRARKFDVPIGKANHPVVNVSWDDAHEYADWAGLFLPTEAQWEKAASWDDSLRKKYQYPWGNKFDETLCNTLEAKLNNTTPVGKYSPDGDSFYGVGDMIGNVCEWTSSLNKAYPYQLESGQNEITLANNRRVVRGGSFLYAAPHARTTCRRSYHPDSRSVDLGFRLSWRSISPVVTNQNFWLGRRK